MWVQLGGVLGGLANAVASAIARKYKRGVESALASVDNVRVDAGGVPVIDHLSFETKGENVLVLGAPRALFEAISGAVIPAQGSIHVGGLPADEAIRHGLAAVAPLDPPLPPKWTPATYIEWSARLMLDRSDARRASAEAIEALKLAPFSNTRFVQLGTDVRRGAVIAAALATRAQTLLLEDPSVGLGEQAAQTMAHVVAAGLHSRTWIVFAGRMPLTSPLAQHADEAIVVNEAHVLAQGAPAAIAVRDGRFALTLRGSVSAFLERLSQRGATVGVFKMPREEESVRVTVDLNGMTTLDVFSVAREERVIVFDLRPVARAFA